MNFTKSKITEKPEICRLCLSFTQTCFSLTENSYFSAMLEALTSLRILPSDNISTIMCLKCCLNLKLAFSIQQKMLGAEQLFQRRLISIPIKQEFVIHDRVVDEPPMKGFDDFTAPIKQESDFHGMQIDEVDLQCKEQPQIKDKKSDKQGEFVCQICGKKWAVKDHFDKHKRVHVTKECPVCGKTLILPSFKRHLEEIHSMFDREVADKYTCDICGSEKTTKRKLDSHRASVHEILKCPLCDKKFEKSRLKEHVLEHNIPDSEITELLKDVIKSHICVVCDREFRTKSFLDQHIYRCHRRKRTPTRRVVTAEKGEKYACDICGKEKPSKAAVALHKNSVHVQGQCPICKKMLSQTNLKRHIERHNDSLTVCDVCGVSVKTLDLRVHMYNNHTFHEFKCNFCDKVFKKSVNRRLHEKKEHLDQADFTCETCGKRFYQKVDLKKHINSTHLKLRPHICEFCKIGFSSRFALSTHKRQHTNEKPFKCEVCGEGFRQNVSLKSHLRSQHGVKQELICECSDCGKKFASTMALASHRRIHV